MAWVHFATGRDDVLIGHGVAPWVFKYLIRIEAMDTSQAVWLRKQRG